MSGVCGSLPSFIVIFVTCAIIDSDLYEVNDNSILFSTFIKFFLIFPFYLNIRLGFDFQHIFQLYYSLITGSINRFITFIYLNCHAFEFIICRCSMLAYLLLLQACNSSLSSFAYHFSTTHILQLHPSSC